MLIYIYDREKKMYGPITSESLYIVLCEGKVFHVYIKIYISIIISLKLISISKPT